VNYEYDQGVSADGACHWDDHARVVEIEALAQAGAHHRPWQFGMSDAVEAIPGLPVEWLLRIISLSIQIDTNSVENRAFDRCGGEPDLTAPHHRGRVAQIMDGCLPHDIL